MTSSNKDVSAFPADHNSAHSADSHPEHFPLQSPLLLVIKFSLPKAGRPLGCLALLGLSLSPKAAAGLLTEGLRSTFPNGPLVGLSMETYGFLSLPIGCLGGLL
jgi:hypothetical protein